jgi:hypothetical protein
LATGVPSEPIATAASETVHPVVGPGGVYSAEDEPIAVDDARTRSYFTERLNTLNGI